MQTTGMQVLGKLQKLVSSWKGGGDLPPVALFQDFTVTANDVVADVGCGGGIASALAGTSGADIISIDIDPQAIEETKRQMQASKARSFRAIVSDCNPVPLPDQTADVVICQEVLEHTYHPVQFLAELVRIGKKGARYLLSVPDPVSENITKIVLPQGMPYFEPPGHQNIFRHEELDQLVRNAGLTVERRIPFGFYWSIWWMLRWSIGSHHAPGSPDSPPILAHWDHAWSQFAATTAGKKAIPELDALIPKSQVLMARKAA
jgi:2-polyprenyl-3-methyl-5-hydroxy-6-metoxy-1,4-benzoquinol methylase